MYKRCVRWGASALAAAAITAGSVVGLQTSAFAGSDNSSDTWAGDIPAIQLPEGTFLAIDYTGYRHSSDYITTPNNIFAKLTGGVKDIPSTGELFTDITRFTYFSSLWDHPLVFEAAATYVDVNKVNIGNLPAPVGGLGPQTIHDGFIDPVVFVSYGLIVEPKIERFLVLTNYFYLPMGVAYSKFAQVNTSTPNQFTWVPQIGYSEGLSKFGFSKLWVDVVANMSVHTDGSAPLALAPGVQFDKLTQSNSYDIKGFLRYEYMPLGFVAVGIEKSWGGDQIASGGLLQTIFGGPTSFGKDDFLKGHVQFAMPLARDLQVAADVTHDFEREGGLKEDITAEIRLTKFFFPAPEPLK